MSGGGSLRLNPVRLWYFATRFSAQPCRSLSGDPAALQIARPWTPAAIVSTSRWGLYCAAVTSDNKDSKLAVVSRVTAHICTDEQIGSPA